MKITRRDIKNTATVSTIVAVGILIPSLIIFFTSQTLDYMVVIALSVAVTPPSIASIIHSRWKSRIEKMTPEFMRDLATFSKTGMPLQTSLEHASRRQYGPLTTELKILVSQMSWGMNFNQALKEFSKRIDLPVINKATVLILEAGRYGGNLSEIFESTAKYVENVNAWSAKRRMQTMPYVAIFYFSVFIYLFIIIILSNMMFTPLAQLNAAGVPLMKTILTPTEARRVFLHTALLESLFGGLIAGKINEDNFVGGLKHATILAISSGLAFYFFFT
ncbi:MAG TPA: type II secretion system F family protein [Candidatus Sulfotelmatobacter sp.]|nr:type II secretion system F family protein [Candidatus Sulfotelmatobacter sp.]